MLADLPDWVERGHRHIWQPYCQMKNAPMPLPVVSTSGVRIKLADGRELIDGISSWWTSCHGYNHPYLLEAVRKQLEVMPHIMFGGMAHPPAYLLAERLVKLLPAGLERVFYADSGSVAIEVAMKMALKYFSNIGFAHRNKFIAFKDGYHGDTMGAMSLALSDGMHQNFQAVISHQYYFDLPHTEQELERFDSEVGKIANTVAALVIEPLVQCAGGMKFHTAEILSAIYRIAKHHGMLVIIDEIATGFGRTGQMFACEEAEITPDIICIGKALAGGVMSLAATLATEQVFNNFLGDEFEMALMHGPTFMANPLACAAANASLDLFEQEPRLAQVALISAQLITELAPLRLLANVKEVRVKGAVAVVELQPNSFSLEDLRKKFIEHGVLIRPIANVIYLMPAFTISPEELSCLTSAILKVLKKL